MDTEWLVEPGLAYLNHGGYGALPVPVAVAAGALRREVEANPTDVFTRRWPGLVGAVRSRVAALVHAPVDELVFVPNATTGTATVLSSLRLTPGDELVTTDHCYGAVARQLDQVAERAGASVRTAHVPLHLTSAAAVVDAVLAEVTERTRLLAVDFIASPTGFVFPVADLVAAAHDAGVPVLVDGAHAPGQLAVDVTAIGADFWVGNLHKWVCSPRACGVLHVPGERQPTVRPLVPSHDFRRGFQPSFDWTGTFDPVPLLAVPAALDFWDAIGWEHAWHTQRNLVGAGARHVAERIGTEVVVADERTAAMRLIALPSPVSAEDGRRLEARLTVDHKVTAYVTHHGDRSFVRVCGQLYNSPDDYDRLAEGLIALLAG